MRNRKHLQRPSFRVRAQREPGIPRLSCYPLSTSRFRAWSFGPSRKDGMPSVLCDGLVKEIENRFGKRKLQHDLAFIVGHFEDRVQETALRAFGLQQLPDHGPRDFPCAIGIAQLLAFGIGDQLVSDAGVEEIPRHWAKSSSVGALVTKNQRQSHTFFVRNTPGDVEPKSASGWSEGT